MSMKMKGTYKRIISLLLITVLISMPSTLAFAKDSYSIMKKDVQDQINLVKSIAAGDNVVVGDGVVLHSSQTGTTDGGITPQWQSGGIDYTHQFIVSRALTILENDKGWSVAQYFYESNGSSILMSATDLPDTQETDWPSFKGHYYDPATGTNYLGETSPTALTRFQSHYNAAVANYSSNIQYAWSELGKALHYLSDSNAPHHAALLGDNTNHGNFESYANTNRMNWGITTCLTAIYTYVNSSTTTTIIKDCATNAKGFSGHAEMTDDTSMSYAASYTLPFAQKYAAAVLYKFLKAVGRI